MEAILQTMDTLSSYQETTEVLRDKRLLSSGGRPLTAPTFLRHTLVVIDGPAHLARRRLYVPFSRPDFIRTVEADVAAEYLPQAFEQSLIRREDDGAAVVDLTRLATLVTVRVAVRIIGIDLADEAAFLRLAELGEPLSQAIILEYVEIDLDEAIAAGEAALAEYWRDYLEPAWRRRLDLVAAAGDEPEAQAALPTDILTILARQYPDGEAGELPLRDGLQWFAAITRNLPAQIGNVFQDLWGWMREHPEDQELLHDDDFLMGALMETMRLHIVSSPVLIREAAEDVTVKASGVQLAKGEKVALSLVDANRDESVFGAETDRYDPRRPGRLAGTGRPYGIAFGDGTHTCPGKQLVLGAAAGLPTTGLELMIVKELVRRGIRPIPGESPERAPHGAEHFTYFPVRVDAAPVESPPVPR
ncbi:MAG: hypothetical protein NVSMB13_11120 [Mycobacteriales bacterium]